MTSFSSSHSASVVLLTFANQPATLKHEALNAKANVIPPFPNLPENSLQPTSISQESIPNLRKDREISRKKQMGAELSTQVDANTPPETLSRRDLPAVAEFILGGKCQKIVFLVPPFPNAPPPPQTNTSMISPSAVPESQPPPGSRIFAHRAQASTPTSKP